MGESCQELTRSLQAAMGKLYSIWDRIGIGKVAKEERSVVVLKHVQALLDDMVEEEETLERQIETCIRDLTQEIHKLAVELQTKEHTVSADLPILQKEKELRLHAETLRKEIIERMKIVTTLKEEDQLLCDRMCMAPYYIPSGTTPTTSQMDELKQHVDKLTKEQVSRFSQFTKMKKEIADLMLELERSPETCFEKEVVIDDDDRFVLSDHNMAAAKALLHEVTESKSKLQSTVDELWQTLHTLWERLEVPKHEQELFEEGKDGFKPPVMKALREEIERCEAQKLANIEKFVDGMRMELEQWWNRCYYSAQQRSEFKHFTTPTYTEKLLTLHEEEVAAMKTYYENHKNILQLVEKRECLFHKMIEFEKRANDPKRFFADRGGKLLMEEKERKALMKQLPKVEQSVRDEIQIWENAHGHTFLVNGMSFIRYIEKTWQDFEEEKQREKDERQKAKTKLMNEEMIYGSKPTTPVKRRFQPTNTPSKTPKHRKVNDISKAPASTSKLQHTSVYHSPYRKTGTATAPRASRLAASTSKMAPGSRSRRRSNRLARKILGEHNEGTNETNAFSQTTLSSNCNSNVFGGNISVASTGSYQDFALQIPHNSTRLRSPTAGTMHF